MQPCRQVCRKHFVLFWGVTTSLMQFLWVNLTEFAQIWCMRLFGLTRVLWSECKSPWSQSKRLNRRLRAHTKRLSIVMCWHFVSEVSKGIFSVMYCANEKTLLAVQKGRLRPPFTCSDTEPVTSSSWVLALKLAQLISEQHRYFKQQIWVLSQPVLFTLYLPFLLQGNGKLFPCVLISYIIFIYRMDRHGRTLQIDWMKIQVQGSNSSAVYCSWVFSCKFHTPFIPDINNLVILSGFGAYVSVRSNFMQNTFSSEGSRISQTPSVYDKQTSASCKCEPPSCGCRLGC